MSITLTPIQHGDLCYGNAWTVADEEALARQVALVALGQSRHVRKILAGSNIDPALRPEDDVRGAIALLSLVAGEDPWHRDGWMFQVMSWIAAARKAPSGVIRSPHMILAHKGFDGLQLEIDRDKGLVTAAVIFEDKATDNPRGMIRDEVWPDFLGLENGDQDNVLTAEVVALLETQPDLDPDSAIENIIWKEARRYRVSITVGDTHNSDTGRRRLFKDYDTTVAGGIERRCAETFYVTNLRAWMEKLANEAISFIKTTVSEHV
jgi:hypothetical protein